MPKLAALTLAIATLCGCGLLPSSPLQGSWSGQMDVELAGDARTITIDITDLERLPTCDDKPDDADCVTLAWTGAWDVYDGSVDFGGDAALSGSIDVLHCVGDDCEASDADGSPIAVDNGYFVTGSEWSDGQRIVLEGTAGEKPESLEGSAWYGYSAGAMTGNFVLDRLD